MAEKYLQTKGLQLLKLSQKTKKNQVDFLSREGDSVVVTEVAIKPKSFSGAAIEVISHARQRELVVLTQKLRIEYQSKKVRVDLLTINESDDEPTLRLVKRVIEYNG